MDEDFHPVAPVGSIPDGTGRAFEVDGVIVAVFRIGDSYHAIDDACPHAGAPLCDGAFEDGVVVCPWHAWRFDVRDGSWIDNPTSNLGVPCHEVKIDDGQVCVKLNE
ncbi:MAG: Rieske 2Fe-2S domain-containing protein [Planctomycetota bacterium]